MTYWIYIFESEENASDPPRVRRKMLRTPLGSEEKASNFLKNMGKMTYWIYIFESEENASDPPRVRRKSFKFPKKYGKNDVFDLYFRIRGKCFGPPSGPKKMLRTPLGSEEKVSNFLKNMGKMTYWIYIFESEENASDPPRVRRKMLRTPLGSEENASDPPRVR